MQVSITRRDVLRGAAVAAAAASAPWLLAEPPASRTVDQRSFHACFAPSAFSDDAELLPAVAAAGISDIWLTGFFYGHWAWSIDELKDQRRRIEKAGLKAHIINIPLGHPGDALGDPRSKIPLAPPKHWKPAVSPDGQTYTGTSLHPPAVEENNAALKLLQDAGFDRVFLDDDFRLARRPGSIGGCFCDEHRTRFLESRGYADGRWSELLADVRGRRRTPLLDAWIDFTCDDLSNALRAMCAAAPKIDLGFMVMVLGAEKAGIRLGEFRDMPMRVGEGHFGDGSFGTVKGKCDELFSSLFHRRFVTPQRAFSESTAYPADRLSASNMAAKLVVSTLSDVRNTMFMSGLKPLPRSHWPLLAPAITRQKALHEAIAGHVPAGPFKHFWGDDQRRVGDDNPYSLFMAVGVPFEVTDSPARDGVTFLGDADAGAARDGRLTSAGTTFVVRTKSADAKSPVRALPEDLTSLFALKRELMPTLKNVPVVLEEKPAVCAWYPSARAVVVWNLLDTAETLTIGWGEQRKTVRLEGLEATLVSEVKVP